MEGWNELLEFRNKFPEINWWSQEKVLFSHKFKFPVNCNNLLIVIGRNIKIKFVNEKIERIIESQAGTNIFIVVEDLALNYSLTSFIGVDKNQNNIEVIPLGYPLSDSIEKIKAKNSIFESIDCSLVFSAQYSTDDMNYVSILPICKYLKSISKNILVLDNLNYLNTFADPLDFYSKINKKTIYGYASLTQTDKESLYKYSKQSAGGVIVEIGRYLGGGTSIIAQAIKDSNKKTDFFSIDPLMNETVTETLLKNEVNSLVKVIVKKSHEVYSEWTEFSDREIDFLFVDGDHRFQSEINDIVSWSRFVKKGGIICVHDYCNLWHNELCDIDIAIYKTLLNDKFTVLEGNFSSFICKKN